MGTDPDAQLKAGDAPNFQHTRTLTGHTRAVASAKFSPDGRTLATASADTTVMLWSLSEPPQPDTAAQQTDTAQPADNTAGPAPATSSTRTLVGHSQGISDVAWSPTGQYLCTASDDNTLRLWDVETGTCLRVLYGHTNYVFCCNFSPHSNLLASGSFDETLRVWDVRSCVCLREVPAHSDPITAVDFSCDGTLIVSSSLDGLCRIWDTATSHCLKTIFDQDSPAVSYVRFTPNGKYLLSASLDGRIRMWDYEKGRAIKFYQGHANKKYCIPCVFSTPHGAPSPVTVYPNNANKSQAVALGDCPWVVTGSEDGNIHVYGLASQQVLQVVGQTRGPDGTVSGQAHTDTALCVASHPSQGVLASCGMEQDPVVKLWTHTPRDTQDTADVGTAQGQEQPMES